jgi:D-arabinose 1-dehydrogenase-like Zn-dependent alcohol dehydrogenase
MPQKCQGVRKYGHDLATQDPHFLGGFAEYCYILPGTWILKLPPDLGDEEATPLNCGVATMASVTEAAETALGDAQSGIGEEECFDEILSYTQIKNINMRW